MSLLDGYDEKTQYKTTANIQSKNSQRKSLLDGYTPAKPKTQVKQPQKQQPKRLPTQQNQYQIRKPSLLNPVRDVVAGVKQTAPQLPQMGVDFAKSAVKNFTPSGIVNTLPAIARGAATGIVDLAPSVAGLGVDVVNSIAGQPIINMPEERRRPLGYALEQWRDIQDTQNNLAIPVLKGQKPADLGIKPATGVGQWISGNTPGAENAQFAETMANFAVPLGSINAGIKGTKIANDAARIASKLNTAQKAKYASQINKLAKKNVANNIKPLTPAQEVWKNTKLGAGLGALEGGDLQEKAGNAFGGAALGAGLSGLHIGGKKAWNSAKGKEIRAAAKEGLNIAANQYPGLSQAIAFLDSTLKTNLSKEGSLTDKRRKVLESTSKNTNLTKNISDRAKSVLDETKDLNKREQRKVQNINQYGEKTYNQQTENGTKEFNPNEQFKENENTTVDKKQKFEFIPENENEPMTGSVPQPEIKPQTQKPKFTNKEKREIREKAEQHRKETNNFKFPEEEQSQAPESNLSHVEEQGNTNLPKEDLTNVKNDSGMSDNIPDGYSKDEFGYIKKNKVSKPYTPPKQKTTGVVKAGKFQEPNQKKQFKNKANKQLENDIKTGSFEETNIKENPGESIVRLEPGEAQGANYLYEKTVGKGNIFENIEKDTPSDRTVGMDEAHKNKLKKLSQKYEVVEDPKTNKNIIVNKLTGKPITPKQRKALAKYFDEYKENNREISAEDRVRAEIEESAEDEVYYDKYRDNLSPTKGEGSTGVERFGAEYKSKNPEFIKWYGEYKKLPDKAKGIELKRKLQEYKNNKKGLEEFYDEFVKQEESDLEATRQRKIGDEYSDTSDIQETERLSEAAKDTEFEFEKEPVEEVKKGISPAQRKLVDNVWDERIVKGKTRKLYAEGRLNSARDSKTAQKVYDKIVDEIKSLDQSPLVKQVMIEDFNKIADKYLENKKRFGTEIKKLENFDYKKEVFDNLSDAIEKDDLGKTAEIIRNNNLKAKYLSPKETKILNEYYEKRTDKVYKQAEELGFKVVTENGGAEHVVYDHATALEWCKNKVKSTYKNNPKKLKMELSRLKNENVVKRMVTSEYKKLINTYETILSNDIKFAYDKPQTSLKEIEGAKGTEKQWEQRKTGDVYNPKSSDVMEGIRKANERIRALKSVIPEETDNTRPALGRIGKELASRNYVVDLKSPLELFKDKIKSTIAKSLFNNNSRQGICVVKKGILPEKSFFNSKTGELMIEEGLSDDVAISKVAHELAHKSIHDAIQEGGNRAINAVRVILGDEGLKSIELTNKELLEIRNNGIKKGLKDNKLYNYEKAERTKLKGEKASSLLKQEVDNNIKDNKIYHEQLNELYKKYGKDFVEDTIDECINLIEQGKTTRSLISDKRNVWKKLLNKIPNNSIEKYCNDIENRVLNGQQKQFNGNSKGTNDGQSHDIKIRSNNESETNGERNRSKGEENKSNDTEEGFNRERRQRLAHIEGSEYSTKTSKVFDFFKKKKVENDKNNPINKIDKALNNKIDDDKVKRVADFFKELSQDRENDFKEYGTFSEEQMKNRLFQQSLTGEGIYTMKGSKGEGKGKLDLSRENKPKVGFTYEKTKQGLGNQGTVESQLSRMLTDQVKRSQARSQVELLKELFGKKEKGFEAVNSKVLWNAIYFGKSKAWYDIVSKGKRSIRNAFDAESAKAFEELFDRVNGKEADIYVPKDVLDTVLSGADELPLDYLSSYGKFKYGMKDILKEINSNHKNKSANIKKMTNSMGESMRHKMKGLVKLAGATLDLYNDRFKRKVLTSASFFTNNRIGNQIMLMANSDSIKDYINTFKDATKLKEGDIPREILESTLSETLNNESNNKVKRYFSKENGKLETFSQILDGQYVDLKTIESLPKKIWFGTTNALVSFPNDIFKRVAHRCGEINEKFERFERKQAASLALKKMNKQNVLKTARSMATVEELAKAAQDNPVLRQTVVEKVNNILGDYNNFNKIEKNVLKRVQPFYSWNRTITRHIINLYKEDPVKATLILYENWRLQHQDDGLEDYQHGSIKLPFENKRTGTNIVINKSRIIPYNTPFELLEGGSLGTLSPFFLKPTEAIRGEKFFKPASEITSKKWKRATQNKVKGYYNNYTGEFREGGLPLGARLGYLAKDYTEFVYPSLGSPLTKGTVDAVKHKIKTGEMLFPDKQYDADLGGFYDGDIAGKYKNGRKTYKRKLSAKNKLDFRYQAANKYLGLGIQPERAKEEVKAKKAKFKKKKTRR